MLREYAADHVGDLRRTPLPGAGSTDVHVHREEVRTVALHVGEGVVGVRLAEGRIEDPGLGDCRHDFFIHDAVELARHVLRSAHRKFNGGGDSVGIAAWEILGLEAGGEQHYGCHEHQREAADDEFLAYGRPADHAGIAAGDEIQEPVHRGEELLIEPGAFLLRPEQARAEHRHERERRGGGHDHDDAHDPSELPEHDAGEAADHREGHEHAEHREGGRDHGDTHLGSSVHRSLLRFLAAGKVRGNVLEHHYGVVHHHSDRDRQGRHRYDVQRVAGREQVEQRSQQGDRDGEDDDERRLEVAEEEEHDQHDHEEGDDDGLQKGVDGVDDLGGAVDDSGYLDVGRKVLLDVLELLLDPLDDVHGIGSGLLLDHDAGGTAAVGVGLLLPFLGAVLDRGHVAQIHRAAARCTHHDVEEFGRIGELLLDAEGIGVGAYVYVSGRQVPVLGSDDLGYAADAEAVSLELVGVAIDLDLTRRGAAHGHRTHSGHAGQRGGHLVVEYLVQSGETGVGSSGKHHDGHVRRAELEDDRHGSPVRQDGIHHVQFVAHVVGGFLDVRSVLEGEGEDGHVLLGLAVEFLEVLHAVQRVLKDLGEVGLDVPGVGALVRGHHHDGVRVELRELGYAGVDQREQAENGERDEHQRSGDRMVDCASVDAHYSATSTLSPSLREVWPLTTTSSPSPSPEVISYLLSKWRPRDTTLRETVLSSPST